jgi:hypothetical protein
MRSVVTAQSINRVSADGVVAPGLIMKAGQAPTGDLELIDLVARQMAGKPGHHQTLHRDADVE